MDHYSLFGDYKNFFLTLLEGLKKLEIDVKQYPIDHFCYRVASTEEYEVMKEKLMPLSKTFIENIHHDRPISKFVLRKPMIIENYAIDVVELPSPKSEQNFPTGLEHFEFALGEDFNAFKEKYKRYFNGSDDNGPFNQPVYIRFDNGNAVKFHEHSLLDVLKMEGKNITYL